MIVPAFISQEMQSILELGMEALGCLQAACCCGCMVLFAWPLTEPPLEDTYIPHQVQQLPVDVDVS
jgi:hypothetical protein